MRRRIAVIAASLGLAACATAATAPAPAASDAYADLLVGRVASLNRDYDAASRRFSAALSRNPNDDGLIEGAVIASLAAGDVAAARRAARMGGGDTPAFARLLLASDQLAAGRTRAADASLRAIEGSAAEELAAHMLQVWTRPGNVDDVVDDLTPLASIRPYGALFMYQQAMALDLAGRDDEALSAYREANGGIANLPPAVLRHADLLARAGARDEALALLNADANAANPELAAAAARIAAGGEAAPRLTAARGAAIAMHGLAAIFLQENDPTNALATLSLALTLDPSLDAARLMFGEIHLQLDHDDVARSTFGLVANSSPYYTSARLMEAWVLADAGQEEEALGIAQSAAATGDARSKRSLAEMYRGLNRNAEAEPIYTELIAASPQDWRLYFARGAAREELDRWSEAEADFQQALALAPEQPEVLNYLAYSWVDRGENLQQALDMLLRAFHARPSSAAIMDSVGWAYYRLGDYAQAQTYLETAVQLQPADATLNDHLGDLYWRTGRRIEARFQWQRALSFETEDAEAIQAKLDHGLPDLPPAQSANR